MIACGRHGARMPGYIVCVHVLDGAHCVHLIPAPKVSTGDDSQDLGEALCATCAEATEGELDIDAVKLVCEHCLRAAVMVGTLHLTPPITH